MKKINAEQWPITILFGVIFGFICIAAPTATQAQENTNVTEPVEQPPEAPKIIPLQVEAGEDQNAVVGRNVLFDASNSTVAENAEVKYIWDFGDGTYGNNVEATHIYTRPGVFRVRLTVTTPNESSEDSLIVSVEESLIVLITDRSIEEAEVKKLYEYGLTQDVLIVNVRDESGDSSFIVTQNLTKKLLSSQNDLKQAEIIITKTASNNGLNALAELAQAFHDQNSEINWKQKTILAITKSKSSTARIAQSTFNLLKPARIILTNEEALFPALSAGTTDKILASIQTTGIDYTIINEYSQRALEKLSPLNSMSYLLNFLINQGLEQQKLLLILMLPVIATIISIARQIIGIKAFGLYIPSIIALTFVVTSIKFGLIIFIILFVTGTLTRIVAKKLRLLYLPRMAIVLTIVSLSILGMFVVAALMNKSGFFTISIFPILIMTILTERFVESQIEKGTRTAIKLTSESLVLSIISYYIVTWEKLQNTILAYPEVILLAIVLNLILGRFTGLRLTEYLRFLNLIKHERNVPPQQHSGNE
ncbi:MAG: hypothetical protein A3B74_03255 [Candidatus Kerfeldbacteria bacterium RIFCSPHIGHO2_02_FULL_42_14]|uniref:PKD domain-containing protein n=1 Tax=Candidatus Kerfeldbacteria bacterium RIFCSPHIGHO2_02_FULL_42_14 TaxID=1798540 RepID=A0A1G2APH8_9BACT|nr:MAG: hypothetical protein A3B74_03255 [Candidatus Kerfeldbacteria bacterium RIFCSPHIGHO2_02_FULL_42_14]OGY80925.1 MAG: hypothetical protein A3E60_03165 [Candidatus Kerfeldbacteria bacterium RIFCSPHIGHO2_12_FULL_42_13]OGY84159.1 MAG: hypothetical protein A3I91_01570 [Candidatus Kerfeldbacteria bacterium RIFCSPLOWO2_02_FULL_42_19]OGY87290.1 MAG: hypothetical protein A3G01_03045 [Candidatus Kerfeldbacteria bacterium RIFCSPLOWO2_12_FULL_43_9]